MKSAAIDIGATAVRVVSISGLDPKSSIALVDKAAIEPLPAGAVVGGQIKDPAQVAFAIRSVLKQAGIPGYGVIMGISSPNTALARVAMPLAMKPSEWAPALRLEDKPITARMPLEASSLSLFPAADANPTDAVRTLIVGAALEDDVKTLLDTAKLAHIAPRALDLSAAATVRCMTRTEPGNTDVATIVDIGASKTSVATRQGVSLRSVRTIDFGGENITRAIMGALSDITFDEAEQRKYAARVGASAAFQPIDFGPGYGDDDDAPMKPAARDEHDVVTDAVSSSADQLIEQIASAVEQDAERGNNYIAPTQGIVLCGGGALLQGLKERVAARLGVGTIVGRPWATLTPGKGTAAVLALADGDEASVMLDLATAVGLAMWRYSK